LILKTSHLGTSLASPEATLGSADGCRYVKINNVPEGVSVAQVIVLFTHTVKKMTDRDEFEFSELCPVGMLSLW
jgi:hypothetical protein